LRDAWVDFILIRSRSLKILSSLVAYRVALLITCSKYAPSNGVYKLNASYGITNFRAMVKIPNWYLHFHITEDFGNETKLFMHDLQLPYQPIPVSIIGFKRTYYNMMTLPIKK
jgi:hypothetical protein